MGKPTLCVDFDGVLHAYTSGWQGVGAIADEPVPGAIEWLRAALEHFDVAIYSSRSKDPKGVEAMRLWLTMWAFELYGHGDIDWLEEISYPTEKPGAFLTIDDRAICFDGDFSVLDPEKLLQFQPWNRGGESDRQRAERLEAECERLRSDNEFLRKRRGELVIERDQARGDLPEIAPPPEVELKKCSHGRVQGTPSGYTCVDCGHRFTSMCNRHEEAPHTPEQAEGPKRGPANSTGDFYGVCPKCERSLEEHVTFYCPDCDAPEQAHGDALAALSRAEDVLSRAAPGDYGAYLQDDCERIRNHLTASGVPEGWKWQTQRDVTDEYFTSLIAPDGTTVYVGEDDKAIAWLERLLSANSGVPKGDYHEGFEEGMRAGHGVPYVPENIARLARRCLWIAFAWNDHNFDGPPERYAREEAKAVGVNSAGEAQEFMETALASAPAVCKWTMDDVGVYESDCGKSWVEPDGLSLGDIHDIEYCHGCGRRIQIAAAPTDGENNG